MKKYHEVAHIEFTAEAMHIEIDGRFHQFKLKEISGRLSAATEIERRTFRVSASGYGIHWPLIDEDLSIDGLLGISHSPEKLSKNKSSI